jgi:hypothetical protein
MSEGIIMRRKLRRRNVGPLHSDLFLGQVSPTWDGYALGRYDAAPPAPTPNNSPNFAYVGAPGRAGQYALEVTVRGNTDNPGGGDYVYSGDKSIGKQRAELIWIPTVDEHRTYPELHYAFSLQFPVGYAYDSTGNELYQIVAQWHDQIFEQTGQTPGYQPVSSLTFRQTPGGGPSLFYQYGLNEIGDARQSGSIPISLGAWYDMRFHYRWSFGGDGFVRAYMNKQFIVQFNGRNLYPAQGNVGNHFRTGMYRGHGSDPTQAQTNTHYTQRLAIAPTEQRLGLAA